MPYNGENTLSSLLEALNINPDRVAIMINGEVIKRHNMSLTKLEDMAQIDILTLAAGG